MASDLLLLLEARLWIARLGESDVMRWWRSDGLLGRDGAFVGPRVLPVTHATGRARIVFAVARHACDDQYPDAKAWHLFRLHPSIEDRLDAMLASKLPDHEYWSQMMAKLEAVTGMIDATELLVNSGLISAEHLRLARNALLGPGERSLPLKAGPTLGDTVRRLTAGFVRSAAGSLAVPYVDSRK